MPPRAERYGRAWRRLQLFGVLAAAAAILLALAGPAPAEPAGRFRLLELDGALIKWGPASFQKGATVSFALLDAGRNDPSAINCRAMTGMAGLLAASGLTQAAFEERLAGALTLWQAAADITFVAAGSADSADIVIGAQAEPRGIAYTNVTHAREKDSRFARMGQATICLNPAVAWRAGGEAAPEAAPVYELGRVLAHELGHAVGLDHPGTRGEVMAFSYQEDLDTLTEGDIAGILLLYGPPRR